MNIKLNKEDTTMNLDRFEKVWAEIMSYFQKVLDFFKNLFGVKDPEAEA